MSGGIIRLAGGGLPAQLLSQGLAFRAVHLEELHRGPSYRRAPEYEGATNREVRGPALAPGVEQRHDSSAAGIDGRKVGPLELVAAIAGKGEVCRLIAPAVLTRNDVLNLVPQKGGIVLVKTAVFASIARSPANRLA